MKEEDKILFNKIRNHLADLHYKWSNDKFKDGHHKSSEGYISISADYPNWFEADSNKEKYLTSTPEYRISVYSYLFGSNRMHDFYSLKEAWEEIKTWHYEPSSYEETALNKFIHPPQS